MRKATNIMTLINVGITMVIIICIAIVCVIILAQHTTIIATNHICLLLVLLPDYLVAPGGMSERGTQHHRHVETAACTSTMYGMRLTDTKASPPPDHTTNSTHDSVFCPPMDELPAYITLEML